MQSPQAKLKQIRRILALWPSQATEDGEELLRGFLLAVEDYPVDDVELAVDTLVKGVAPGVNPSFRPKPAETGAECRRQMNLRLDRQARDATFRPKLPPPDIQHDPESQARVKAKAAALIASLTAMSGEVDTKRRLAILNKTNERFDRELAASRGYTVGDDGEAVAV